MTNRMEKFVPPIESEPNESGASKIVANDGCPPTLQPSHLPADLVKPLPSEEMKAWRVAKLQGNGPHLLEPVAAGGVEAARGLF